MAGGGGRKEDTLLEFKNTKFKQPQPAPSAIKLSLALLLTFKEALALEATLHHRPSRRKKLA